MDRCNISVEIIGSLSVFILVLLYSPYNLHWVSAFPSEVSVHDQIEDKPNDVIDLSTL